MTLLIATTNRGKIEEIADLLSSLNIDVIGLDDLPDPPPPVEETEQTFAGNARLKAEYYYRTTGLLTLADDSGLAVDALGGRPGVLSARYGGTGTSSADQISLLLNELEVIPEDLRTARFVCSVALIGTGIDAAFEGISEGRIAREPAGEGGFGYDPIFLDLDLGRTYAQLSRTEKSTRSHRGKALTEVRKFLRQVIIDN